MKLNKLIKKLANYNKIDILSMDGTRIFPVEEVALFKHKYNIEDLKKYKIFQIITFTQEPGVVTVYVEECKNANN